MKIQECGMRYTKAFKRDFRKIKLILFVIGDTNGRRKWEIAQY